VTTTPEGRPSSERTARAAVDIAAPPARVWAVLTEPGFTRQYMFGCEAVTDWRPGSPLDWRGTWEGEARTFVVGHVVACEPPRHLAYTTADPAAAEQEPVERRVQVRITLTPLAAPAGTRLEVSQGDFAGLPRGEERYQETQQGWSSVLPQVKALAEAG
jgi:uncharacterized protein YndB with AHSA1/START domain